MEKLDYLQEILSNIYIFTLFLVIYQVENHAYWQKHFIYELRLQETPGTISRSAFALHWQNVVGTINNLFSFQSISLLSGNFSSVGVTKIFGLLNHMHTFRGYTNSRFFVFAILRKCY